MSLGEFYDYYNHPARRELWLAKAIPIYKSVKGPILHLEVNINMAAVSSTFVTVGGPIPQFAYGLTGWTPGNRA